MRKVFLIIVILILVQHMFSQDESNYVALGLYINPNIMYRTAWIRPGHKVDNFYKKFLKNDYPILGYNYGVSLTWEKFQFGSIEAGIFLNQRGYCFSHKIEVPDSIANFQYDPGFLFPEEFHIKDIYYYIDIPLILKRNILERKKISFYGKGGISLNMLLRDNILIHTYYIDDTEGYDRNNIKFKELKVFNFRRLNISTVFSVGTNISITQNIDIQAEAIMDCLILPFFKGGDYSIRFFETGIKTGISYKF